MKKSKLLIPLASTIAIIGTITPMVMMVSCGKKDPEPEPEEQPEVILSDEVKNKGVSVFSFTLKKETESTIELNLPTVTPIITQISIKIGDQVLGLSTVTISSKKITIPADKMTSVKVTIDSITLVSEIKKVESITLDKTTLNLEAPKTETLTATVLPSDASYKDVKWESSDPTVATVDDGVVKAVGAGTTIIKASALDDSGKFATCTVTATSKRSDFINKANDWVDGFMNATTIYSQEKDITTGNITMTIDDTPVQNLYLDFLTTPTRQATLIDGPTMTTCPIGNTLFRGDSLQPYLPLEGTGITYTIGDDEIIAKNDNEITSPRTYSTKELRINKNGYVTKWHYYDGTKWVKYEVTYNAEPHAPELCDIALPERYNLEIGKEGSLTAILQYNLDEDITWSVEEGQDIIEINTTETTKSGKAKKIKALKEGEVRVSASCGEFSKVCVVTVLPTCTPLMSSKTVVEEKDVWTYKQDSSLENGNYEFVADAGQTASNATNIQFYDANGDHVILPSLDQTSDFEILEIRINDDDSPLEPVLNYNVTDDGNLTLMSGGQIERRTFNKLSIKFKVKDASQISIAEIKTNSDLPQ